MKKRGLPAGARAARVEPGLVASTAPSTRRIPQAAISAASASRSDARERRIAEAAQPEVAVPDVPDERSGCPRPPCGTGSEGPSSASAAYATGSFSFDAGMSESDGVVRVDDGRRSSGPPRAPRFARDRRAARAAPGRGAPRAARRRAPAGDARRAGRRAPQSMGRGGRRRWARRPMRRRGRRDNRVALDDPLPELLTEIRSLLDVPADAEPPPRAVVDHTLTTGTRYALALEARAAAARAPPARDDQARPPTAARSGPPTSAS